MQNRYSRCSSCPVIETPLKRNSETRAYQPLRFITETESPVWKLEKAAVEESQGHK